MSYDISTLKKGDYTKFQRFLENDQKRKEFKLFLLDRHCSENLEAWELMTEYNKVDNNIINSASTIFTDNNDNNNANKIVVKKTTSADKAVENVVKQTTSPTTVVPASIDNNDSNPPPPPPPSIVIVSDVKIEIANKILKQYIRFDSVSIANANTPIDITERKRKYIEQVIKKGMYPNDLFDSIKRELFITMLMDSFRKYNDWIDSNQKQQQRDETNSKLIVYKTYSMVDRPISNKNNKDEDISSSVIVKKRVSLSSNVTRTSSVDDNHSNNYNPRNKNHQQQIKNTNNSTSIHDVILKLKASLSSSSNNNKSDEQQK